MSANARSDDVRFCQQLGPLRPRFPRPHILLGGSELRHRRGKHRCLFEWASPSPTRLESSRVSRISVDSSALRLLANSPVLSEEGICWLHSLCRESMLPSHFCFLLQVSRFIYKIDFKAIDCWEKILDWQKLIHWQYSWQGWCGCRRWRPARTSALPLCHWLIPLMELFMPAIP